MKEKTTCWKCEGWISVGNESIPRDKDIWIYQHGIVHKSYFGPELHKKTMNNITKDISHWMPYKPLPPN